MKILDKVLKNSTTNKKIKKLAPKPSNIIPQNSLFNRHLLIMITLLSYLQSIILSSFIIIMKNPEFSQLSMNLLQISILSLFFILSLIVLIITYIIIQATHTTILNNNSTVSLLILLGASNNFIIKRIVYTFTKTGLLGGLFGTLLSFLTVVLMSPFLNQLNSLLNEMTSSVVIVNYEIYQDIILFLWIPLFIGIICAGVSYFTSSKIIKEY